MILRRRAGSARFSAERYVRNTDYERVRFTTTGIITKGRHFAFPTPQLRLINRLIARPSIKRITRCFGATRIRGIISPEIFGDNRAQISRRRYYRETPAG